MIEQVLEDIRWLFVHRGRRRYEPGRKGGITQLEHALQAAALAESCGADDVLVTAALLHDLGHLVQGEREDSLGVMDLHQYRALPLLATVFDDTVLGPIRLHVDARRLLAATEPGYVDALGIGDKRSLALAGGPFSSDEAARFIVLPHAREAILICRWDDWARAPGRTTPDLDHFLFVARRAVMVAQPEVEAVEAGHRLVRRAASGERVAA